MSEAPSVFAVENLLDPYPMYRQLRDEAPVLPLPEMNMYYVTRYDLVREVLKNTDTYSSRFDEFMAFAGQAGLAGVSDEALAKLREYDQQLEPRVATLLTLDEPDHKKYRSLVSELFTGSAIKASEDQVKTVIDRVADEFKPNSGTDYMAGFAFPVPLDIIATRLGIPAADRALFNDGATAAAAGLRMSPLPEEEVLRRGALAVQLQKLLIRLIEEARETPRDDMISVLANSRLEDEERLLSHAEILSILQQFLVAGHETTTSTFGWGMVLLCRYPELQDQLRGNPAEIKVFVEEALRIEAPVQGLPRKVVKDTVLGGQEIEAGALVMLRYGAANRDERQFEDPDTVNIHRKKAGMQLAFGSGVHHCIGAPLARQELNLGFYALLERMKNIRMAPGHAEPVAEPSFILRNLPELYIEFDQVS